MKIERLMLDGLEHYDSRLKGWMGDKLANAGAFRNWRHTEKAGAVTCWPVGGTPLEPSVDFMFSETPPANGEPKAPDNPSTITGVSSIKVTRCGKNLIKYPFYNTTKIADGVEWTDNGDGTVTANRTSSGNIANFRLNAPYWVSTGDDLFPSGHFFLSGCPAGGNWNTYCLRSVSSPEDSEYVSNVYDIGNGVNVTVTKPSVVSLWCDVYPDVPSGNLLFCPQIEVGSIATSFEKYEGDTYTVQLGSTYYGGTLDVASGVMTVTQGQYAFNGTENITNWTVLENVGRAAFPLNRITALWDGVQACTHLPYTYAWGGDYIHFYVNMAADQNGAIIFAPYFTQEAMKAWMASQYANGTPVTIVWTLRQPFTVQLTPTQILSLTQTDKYTPRLNTVYTNASSVQVGYRKSPIRDYYEKTQAIIAQGGEV